MSHSRTILAFASACWVCSALAAPPQYKTYETKHYVIYTDLPAHEAREAQVRMARMAEEFLSRTAGFSGQLTTRLPFYLYKNLEDYKEAGGAEGSGGYFDGEKLMAVTLRRDDGVISLATWHIVQHEGFHQFAHAVIGGEIPMWADEGLAEYFGEGLFTGDGFVAGLIPQARLVRVQRMLGEHGEKPWRAFLSITREQWNASKIEMKNYDQAWSIVHFLAHGDDNRYQKLFNAFMHDVGKGEDAARVFRRYFGGIPDLETRCREWWLNLPDHPTSPAYARAALAMLTSFLARVHAQGQSFPTFEAFIKTPPQELKQNEEDWLPPRLLSMAIAEAAKLRTRDATFVLAQAPGRPPTILLTLKDGTKLAGRFTLTPEGRIESVRTDVLANAPQTKPTTRSTTRPHGEMLH